MEKLNYKIEILEKVVDGISYIRDRRCFSALKHSERYFEELKKELKPGEILKKFHKLNNKWECKEKWECK